jgi:hypothetical protein
VIGSQYETGMPKPNGRLSKEIMYVAEQNIIMAPKCFLVTLKVKRSCNKYSSSYNNNKSKKLKSPPHAVKVYRGSEGIAPLCPNFGTRWR